MAKEIIQQEIIENKIFLIRGQKVMIDRDIAQLYGVETRTLNQAVTRNFDRFPEDFMFQLTHEEYESLRSQNVILKGRGQHSKYLPYAFSEHGALMLATVLRSERAIQVSIEIIRVFNKIREIIQNNKEIIKKIEELERNQTTDSKAIWNAVSHLRKEIGEIKYSKK